MRRKLTEIDKYTIVGALQGGMTREAVVKQLAKKLGLSAKPVEEYLATLEDVTTPTQTEQSANGNTPYGILHKTAGGKSGVTIMTKTGAEIGDEAGKANRRNPPPRDCIKKARP